MAPLTSATTASPKSIDDHAGAMSVSPPAPSRVATWSAYASAIAATIGFMPLHLVWAFGIPLWADAGRFQSWYDAGGATYLLTLNALALLPALLAMALVRSWGQTFPSWLPWIAGRHVPRMLLVVPGTGLSVLLLAYTIFAAVVLPSQWNDPHAIFEPCTVLYGIAQFLVWALGLAFATYSYARRTATS